MTGARVLDLRLLPLSAHLMAQGEITSMKSFNIFQIAGSGQL